MIVQVYRTCITMYPTTDFADVNLSLLSSAIILLLCIQLQICCTIYVNLSMYHSFCMLLPLFAIYPS